MIVWDDKSMTAGSEVFKIFFNGDPDPKILLS